MTIPSYLTGPMPQLQAPALQQDAADFPGMLPPSPAPQMQLPPERTTFAPQVQPSAPVANPDAPIHLTQPLMMAGRSGGGLTAMGKLAQVEMPAMNDAERAAEQARAGGMQAQGDAEKQIGGAIEGGNIRAGDLQFAAQQSAHDQRGAIDAYKSQLDADAQAESAEKLDPSRVFQSGGKKVLAIMGMMFGGALQGRLGLAANPFQASMDRLIQRDLDEQRSTNEAHAKGRSTRINALKLNVQKFGDEQAGYLKTQADMWDSIAHQADAYRAIGKGQQFGSEAEAMRDLAGANAAKARMTLAEYLAKQTQGGTAARINPLAAAEYQARGGDTELAAKARDNLIKLGVSPGLAGALALGTSQVSKEERMAREKNAAETGKRSSEGASQISKELTSNDIPAARAQVAKLREIVDSVPPGEEIPGFGMMKNAWANGDMPTPLLSVGGKIGGKLLMSDEGKTNRQLVKTAILNHHKALNGGEVRLTPEALEQMTSSFMGSGSTRAIRNSVNRMEEEINAKEAAVLGGASPEAQAKFHANESHARGTIQKPKITFQRAK